MVAMEMTTRREFLRRALKASLGVAAGPTILSMIACRRSQPEATSVELPDLPYAELTGSYRDIGKNMGLAFKRQIKELFQVSQEFRGCVQYGVGKDGSEKIQSLLAVTKQRFPQFIEELEGLSEGIGEPFLNVFAWNCRSEIGVLKKPSGCSTIVLCREGRFVLAHNEDGHEENLGRIFIARVLPPSGIAFLSLVYPGILPGVGPGMNSRGIVQTTNYIAPLKLGEGIPRYFIGRAILEAGNLEQAIEIAVKTERAHPWHHNLGSLTEGRIVSVETFPERCSIKNIQGIYVHANHLVHEEMTGLPEDKESVALSSLTRYKVVTEAVREKTPENAEEMIRILSSHQGRPYSPCRHPEGSVHGATLAAAVFQSPETAMTLYRGNPCKKHCRKYHLP
jgi:predicted choloylglycine hydrolase